METMWDKDGKMINTNRLGELRAIEKILANLPDKVRFNYNTWGGTLKVWIANKVAFTLYAGQWTEREFIEEVIKIKRKLNPDFIETFISKKNKRNEANKIRARQKREKEKMEAVEYEKSIIYGTYKYMSVLEVDKVEYYKGFGHYGTKWVVKYSIFGKYVELWRLKPEALLILKKRYKEILENENISNEYKIKAEKAMEAIKQQLRYVSPEMEKLSDLL